MDNMLDSRTRLSMSCKGGTHALRLFREVPHTNTGLRLSFPAQAERVHVSCLCNVSLNLRDDWKTKSATKWKFIDYARNFQ